MLVCISKKARLSLSSPGIFMVGQETEINCMQQSEQGGSLYVGHFLYTALTDVPLVLENNAEFRIEFYNVISLFKDEVCLFH